MIGTRISRLGQGELPQIWPDGRPVEQMRGTWLIAHVKPRQEKSLAQDISALGGGYFLPMYDVMRRKGHRRWKSTLPLFSGYVFLCCADQDVRLAALKTNRIVRLIEVSDQKQLIGELSALQRLLGCNQAILPLSSLRKGTPCRIRTGPLQGVEGKVERRSGSSRFVVEVGILGQGASVEIDEDQLEPLD